MRIRTFYKSQSTYNERLLVPGALSVRFCVLYLVAHFAIPE